MAQAPAGAVIHGDRGVDDFQKMIGADRAHGVGRDAAGAEIGELIAQAQRGKARGDAVRGGAARVTALPRVAGRGVERALLAAAGDGGEEPRVGAHLDGRLGERAGCITADHLVPAIVGRGGPNGRGIFSTGGGAGQQRQTDGEGQQPPAGTGKKLRPYRRAAGWWRNDVWGGWVLVMARCWFADTNVFGAKS